MERQGALRKQWCSAAKIILERLQMQLCDEAAGAKELIAISKEARAMAEMIQELDPAKVVKDFRLKLSVEDD